MKDDSDDAVTHENNPVSTKPEYGDLCLIAIHDIYQFCKGEDTSEQSQRYNSIIRASQDCDFSTSEILKDD